MVEMMQLKIKRRLLVDLLIFLPLISVYFLIRSDSIHTDIIEDHDGFFYDTESLKGRYESDGRLTDNLIRLFGKEPDLSIEGDFKRSLSNSILKDGAFRFTFFNNLNYEDYCRFEFKKNVDNYYCIEIRTGPFEKLILSKVVNGNKTILAENMIPLSQNNINMFQVDYIGEHLIIFVNKFLYYYRKEEFSNIRGYLDINYELDGARKSDFSFKSVSLNSAKVRELSDQINMELTK